MRPTGSSPASAAIFALPPLLLSAIFSPVCFSGHAGALAEVSGVNAGGKHSQSPNILGDKDTSRGRGSGYEDLVERYVPDFVGISRGIIGRAGDETQALANNAPGKPQDGIQGGQTQYYTFPKTVLLGPKSTSTPGLPSTLARRDAEDGGEYLADELKKRQTQAQLYVTLNTCSQPLPNTPNANGAAGQLQLYVSTSSSNQKPDQNNNNYAVPVDGGYANLTLNATDDVFFSVAAPSNNGFTGSYNYELTASIDDFYASYIPLPYNRVVDTDTTSVLLYTNDTTSENSSMPVFQQWMQTKAFSVYIYSQQNPSILGIQKSWCALQTSKQSAAYVNPGDKDNTSMTTAVDGQPKQQFHVQGLNGSSNYYAFMVVEGNSTQSGGGVVNGGGTVWAYTNFTTKSGNNCAIIYNLPFCSDVGYAVPWNPKSTNSTLNTTHALATTYDNNASAYYEYFDKSLQQVPCNTTSSAQYSLARNCTDCANAYKQWLCAVVIPRCEDFSNPAPYLLPRAVGQNFINDTITDLYPTDTSSSALTADNQTVSALYQSRNPLIDAYIAPGPYKEVLPCKELCYNLVQSCPALLQFSCPLPGFGLNWTYGVWNSSLAASGEYSCNPMTLQISRGSSLQGHGRLGTMIAFSTILWAMAM